VRVAYDSHHGLSEAPDWAPATAFIDIGMPGMNGYELAGALRQQGSTALLVAVTGWGSEVDEARSKSTGFDLHMTKPAHPEAVQAALQQLF